MDRCRIDETKECSKVKKKTLLLLKFEQLFSDENNPRDSNVIFHEQKKQTTKNVFKGHPTIHYTLHGIVQFTLFRRVSVLHWVGWLS